MFDYMGRVVSFAFKDISSKVNILRNASQNRGKPDIQSLILEEIETNYKVCQGPSTARTALRLLWFLDYVQDLFENLKDHKNRSFRKIVIESYKKKLGIHHKLKV